MTDIVCCQCRAITRGIEQMKGQYLTVQSGFTKSAADSCDNCGHDFCETCKRTEITDIQIEKDVKEYLDELLFGDGQEAWYCGGIKLDLKDYNGAIKQLANNYHFQRCCADDKISLDNMPFDETIRVISGGEMK